MADELLVYDGDCDFCRLWVERWRARTGERVAYEPFQKAAKRFPERPLERFQRSVQYLDARGTWYEGAQAVFRLTGLGWLYRLVGAPSEIVYRWIADHRPLAMRWTKLLWGRHVVPPGEARTTWLFQRVLGVVYLAAFLSLWPQLLGLFGAQGVVPVTNFMRSTHEQIGGAAFWAMPSVLWLGAGDGALRLVCGVGVACAGLLAVGALPAVGAIGAWACYLSLTSVGGPFLWFQWDALLLEVGFLALFLAPWRVWSRPGADPPRRIALWLGRWLLFRFLIASAAVKLSSGDPSWHALTALRYHYETQPIPPPLAWYFHHLPAWFQTVSVIFMFTVEGGLPFLLFAPRRVRFLALAVILTLQTLIFVTGNFGFFNLLTLALCVLWLDDGILGGPRAPAHRTNPVARWAVRAVAVAVLLLGIPPFISALDPVGRWPRQVMIAEQLAAPWRVANGYGLFAIMTTTRAEIMVEGSSDGRTWEPYAFRYKPGDPKRPPPFLGPHMPRLDWQMWFAALDGVRATPWFLSFCQRLLEGSPSVRGLLAATPAQPPRFVRARLDRYRFTTPDERHLTGAWWHVDPIGLYCPPLTLEGGQLTLAPLDSL